MPTNGSRPAPHDLNAEEGLIGAMLLSADAIDAALAAVGAGDFYKPAHGHIFWAITSLNARSVASDTTTVADMLRQDGLLDAVGGPAELIHLMAGVPAIGNASHYAAIVAKKAAQRRLQATALELGEAALDGDDAAAERALEQARVVVTGNRPALVVEDLGAVIRGEEPEISPTILHRSDGKALIYPGLLHWVMGEPGCGKTWFALVAALATAKQQLTSLYLDYEGSRRIVGGRLARLGATEWDVTNISYVRPSGGSVTSGPAAARIVKERDVGLVVIDGAAKAMAREGLDEDRASEVLGFLERMVWPLCEAGAAVVILDHVPKDKDSRGRWARGSGAKLGEVDGAAYGVEVRDPWSRAKAGAATVRVAKDREGVVGAVGDVAAVLRFVPVNGDLRATLESPSSEPVANTAMAAVELVVRAMGGQTLSQAHLEREVRQHGRWRNDVIRSAAENLAASGRIRVDTGPRNARLYSSIEALDETPVLPIEEAF